MKVMWSDGNLQVVAGDEIEILRGFGKRDSAQIQATKIHNKTRGTIFTSGVEGVLSTRMPHDFTPPIHGYAKNIEMHGREGAWLKKKLRRWYPASYVNVRNSLIRNSMNVVKTKITTMLLRMLSRFLKIESVPR